MAALWFGSNEALTGVRGSQRISAQTFIEVNEAGNRIGSGLLELGASRGDRVGVLAHNVAEVFNLWLGFDKHNLVRAVMHTHVSMNDHVRSLNDIGASTLLFDTRFTTEVEAVRDQLTTVKYLVAIGPDAPDWAVRYEDVEALGTTDEPDLDVDENAPCSLQLTSATTGTPKAWVKSYRSWNAVINHNLHHLDTFGPEIPPVGPDDVNLHFHALQWASGFQTLYPYLIRGARTVLLDDAEFDPEVVVETILREGVTSTFAPAPLWGPILDVIEFRGGIDHQLRRVVLFFSSAELDERTTRLLGPVWAHGFGSTEQGAITTRLLPADVAANPQRSRSVGRPGSPFFEVTIKDPEGNTLGPNQTGEICVRSAMSLGEYWGRPDVTTAASFPGDWFRSSDIGYLDKDGFLYYSDRAGDAITTASGAVYPHLIEAALGKHSAVYLSGVVGAGDPAAQTVVAFVQVKEGWQASEQLAHEILDAAKTDLAEHELPARIEFMAELPTVLGGERSSAEHCESRWRAVDHSRLCHRWRRLAPSPQKRR